MTVYGSLIATYFSIWPPIFLECNFLTFSHIAKYTAVDLQACCRFYQLGTCDEHPTYIIINYCSIKNTFIY